jgi:hypothetical protein
MKFPHHLGKGSRLAEDSGRQQMGLRGKRTRLQTPVLALAHGALHILVREFQVLEQDPFKLG